MCMRAGRACDAIQPLGCLLFLSDRRLVKITFWHQQLKASAHASGTKVSLFSFVKTLSLSLSFCLCLHDCLPPVSVRSHSFFHQSQTARLAPPIKGPFLLLLPLFVRLYFTLDLRAQAFIYWILGLECARQLLGLSQQT